MTMKLDRQTLKTCITKREKKNVPDGYCGKMF